MNYPEAEQFLLSLANLPRREYMINPKPCAVYLDRLQFFLNILDNPEKKIPHYIHVTGTSGKGSVCAFLQSILNAAGKPTGLYVSPHPIELTERWWIGNKKITKREFVIIVKELKPKLDEYIRRSPYDMLSHFDLTTAIAFYYFAKLKVEWAVIEAGCGGRYDSTNVMPYKDIAVITNVDLDHTEILGNTKKQIAHEKSGIIKSGCKVFSLEKNKKVLSVIAAECDKKRVTLQTPVAKFKILNSKITGADFIYRNESYHLKTFGHHQVENASLVIDIAKQLGLPQSAIKRGLAQAKQPLRLEIISQKPLIILDGAHNPDKIKSTIKTIKTLSLFNNINLIISFSKNKDINSMVKQLITLNPALVACTRNTVNPFRKLADPADLAKLFKKLLPNATIQIFLDPYEAFSWTRQQTKINDIILVTGSIFLSGELKKYLRQRPLKSAKH